MVPYVLFGFISVAFGIAVYYFWPLGQLSANLGMVLAIFFSILIAMMAGLTLLVTNLQGFLEIILVYVFFFWEKKSMITLLRKNLGAHKQRNYLTSIIYSLTLGCIIFFLVTANLEILSISSINEVGTTDIFIGDDFMSASLIDSVLIKYASSIKDFGFVTADVISWQAKRS